LSVFDQEWDLEIIAQNNLKVDILLTVNTAFMFKSKEITL